MNDLYRPLSILCFDCGGTFTDWESYRKHKDACVPTPKSDYDRTWLERKFCPACESWHTGRCLESLG